MSLSSWSCAGVLFTNFQTEGENYFRKSEIIFSTSLLTWTRLYGSFEMLYKHCGPCPSSAREVITGGKAPRGLRHAEPVRSPSPGRESPYKSYTLSGLLFIASPSDNQSGETRYNHRFHVCVKAVEFQIRTLPKNQNFGKIDRLNQNLARLLRERPRPL